MTLIELLISLIPALCLFAALYAGRYPGEELVAKLSRARTSHERRRAPASLPAKPRRPRTILRSGELVARSLATRPPPAPLCA
jgi:hypothetical protein